MSIKLRLSRYLPTRRRLLATLARLPLLTLSIPALARPVASAPHLDQHARRTIAAVIDRMLPGDDLPGGLALQIDRAVVETADAETLRGLALGVAWLDAKARAGGAAGFLALGAPAQDTVLRAAHESNDEGAEAVAQLLRRRALMRYYTDEAVMAAFPYTAPPQPSGFPDFQEAPQ